MNERNYRFTVDSPKSRVFSYPQKKFPPTTKVKRDAALGYLGYLKTVKGCPSLA